MPLFMSPKELVYIQLLYPRKNLFMENQTALQLQLKEFLLVFTVMLQNSKHSHATKLSKLNQDPQTGAPAASPPKPQT